MTTEQPTTPPGGIDIQNEEATATERPKHRGQKPIKERVGGPLTHIVMFSGGMGSYLAAKRTVAKFGTDRVKLLFADTTIEDEDLYRFLHQAAELLGSELVILKDGRDVWQVYKDARYIGNTRADPCSQVLKRQPLNRWVAERYHPEDCCIVVGIDWSEIHRYHRLQERNHPWSYSAPLCEAPYLDPAGMKKALDDDGLELPRLYKMGMPHNNCGGFCCKAGQAQFAHLLKIMPERYRHHEKKEQELRSHLQKDVAILRDRTGGTTRPLTLKALRERIEAKQAYDKTEWGGCGCFAGT